MREAPIRGRPFGAEGETRVDGISFVKFPSYHSALSLMRINAFLPPTPTDGVSEDCHIRIVIVGAIVKTSDVSIIEYTYRRLACAIRPRRNRRPKAESGLGRSQCGRHPPWRGSNSAWRAFRSLHPTPARKSIMNKYLTVDVHVEI